MPWFARWSVKVLPSSASVTTTMPTLSLLRFGGAVVGEADAVVGVGRGLGGMVPPVVVVADDTTVTLLVVDDDSAPASSSVVVVVERPAAASLCACPPLQAAPMTR